VMPQVTLEQGLFVGRTSNVDTGDNMPPTIDKHRIERVARMYGSNKEAAAALGIQPGSFGRLCRLYDVATPIQRRRQKAQTRY
jgi:hypothetical protein